MNANGISCITQPAGQSQFSSSAGRVASLYVGCNKGLQSSNCCDKRLWWCPGRSLLLLMHDDDDAQIINIACTNMLAHYWLQPSCNKQTAATIDAPALILQYILLLHVLQRVLCCSPHFTLFNQLLPDIHCHRKTALDIDGC
jgi:hypothetical protein